MKAGRLRHRVELQEKIITQNSKGEITESWSTIKKISAEIVDLSVRDYISSQSLQSEITTRITIRARAIKPTMRIVHKNTIYTIVGTLDDPKSKNEHLTITAKKGAINE